MTTVLETGSMDPTTADRLRQGLVLLTAIAAPVAGYLAFAGTTFRSATGADLGDPPIIPAGYAFSIWGLIYTACIGYGIYQALPAQATDPLLRSIGWWTALAFTATALWVYLARFRLTWWTVACMAVLLLALVVTYARLLPATPFEGARLWLVWAPLSIFLGWVTVAAVANVSASLQASGVVEAGLGEGLWAMIMLVVATAIVVGVLALSGGDIFYAAVIVWAFVAVAVRNLPDDTFRGVGVTAALMVIIVIIATIVTRARAA